ncbi:MAG: ABC transporter permease [Myxococcaceae bacterium]
MPSPLKRAASAVLGALAMGWLLLALVEGSPAHALEAYKEMLWGGIGDFPRYFEGAPASVWLRPWGESAVKATLLTLTGLSVAVGLRAGLFNVGAQGQLLWGALGAAWVGALGPWASVLHIALALSTAALAGGLWASVAATLREWRGVHEVISTILLNWVALSLIENWLVPGPLRAGGASGASIAGTAEIVASAQLPRLLGETSRLHAGFPLAVALCVGVWIWLSRSTHGWETKAVGLNLLAAETAGIATRARRVQAMFVSGALAGLAGAVWVLGTEGKYPAHLGAPYGFDGIAMALIGQLHPLGVFLASVLFGVLRAGGARMQLVGVHPSYPELLQAFALIGVAALAAPRMLKFRRKRKDSSSQVPRVAQS